MFVPGPGSMDVPMNAFSLEVDFQLRMSSVRISLSVYNAWTSSYPTTRGDAQQDVLVMDRLDETIFEKTRREKEYTSGVMVLISRMWCIVHDYVLLYGTLSRRSALKKNIVKSRVLESAPSRRVGIQRLPQGVECTFIQGHIYMKISYQFVARM